MAIKLPDPGNGIPEQKTGNDEWTNMKIVRDNFADPSNAASRLVGKEAGNLMQVGAFGLGSSRGEAAAAYSNTRPETGLYSHNGLAVDASDPLYLKLPTGRFTSWLAVNYNSSTQNRIVLDNYHGGISTAVYISSSSGPRAGDWAVHYHSKNTTVDSNKNIKTSSPVVRVFSDHLDKIHEANDLPIKYTRNDVGDYTIEGTTGLRENDWQIVIPKDDHDNQLIAFTIEDDNGTIRLKTYKRTFNMTTFMFEPDLKTPLDIPEGRWVDLHFNDLPQEQTDESTI